MDVCCAQGRAAAPGERRWDQGCWGPGGRRLGEGIRALLLLGHLCFLLPLFAPLFWSFSSSSLGAGAAPPPGRLPPSQLTPRSSLASPPLSPKVAAGRRRAAHFQALGRQGKRCVPSDAWFHRITLLTFTPSVSVLTLLPTSLLEATQGAERTLGAAGSLSVWDGFQF